MAKEQEKCTITQEFIKSEKRPKSSIDLKLVPITGQCSMWADVTYGRRRPVVPLSFRRKVFSAVHDLKHPGPDRTTKMVTDRYLWPGMRKELHAWSQQCHACQSNKTGRHTKPVPGFFAVPMKGFSHIHLDLIGPFEESRGYRYALTIMDRTTRFPYAVPLKDKTQ